VKSLRAVGDRNSAGLLGWRALSTTCSPLPQDRDHLVEERGKRVYDFGRRRRRWIDAGLNSRTPAFD
jgi:hypothetical protein